MERSVTQRQEREANAFACALLMPKEWFLKEWKRLEKLNDEDKRIEAIAKTFQVPLFAVFMRIQMLSKELT